MHLFSVISANITINHTLPKKLDSLDYISVADIGGLASTSFTQLAFKLTHSL